MMTGAKEREFPTGREHRALEELKQCFWTWRKEMPEVGGRNGGPDRSQIT